MKVLELLMVNRLIDPGSEVRVHANSESTVGAWEKNAGITVRSECDGCFAGCRFSSGGEGSAVSLFWTGCWSTGTICSCICSSDGERCWTRSLIWFCTI